MSNLAQREFERILIIKPSSPGDIIHALPVLRGLRTRYPKAHLAWLVATPFANLIEADPALDEVIRFDRKRFGHMWRSPRISAEFFSFVRSLRSKRFDLIVDLQGLVRSGFLSLASGARDRIGFRAAREGAWLFYNRKIAGQDPDLHAADKNMAVADMLGFERRSDFAIAMTDADRARAASLLTEAGVETSHQFAVLVPATRWETKCWPVSRYGELARILESNHGIRSVLVGGPSDVDDGNTAVEASNGNAASLCGQTTLRELAAVIDRAAIVITADSTPMHMAAAHGRPLVALFGPTNPDRTGPHGRRDDVIRLDLDCSPCYLRNVRQCPHAHRCMQDLGVDRVAKAVAERIAS